MGYRVVRYDTVNTAEGFQLLESGQYPSAFHVLATPGVGADLEIAIGQSERFPIFAGLVVELCPPSADGLRLWNNVSIPGELVVLVWFEGGSSQGPS